MRLIDKDNVIHALEVFSDMEHGDKHFMYGIESAKEIVNECETIDAAPMVDGGKAMNIADDLVKAYNDGYQQGKKDAVVRGEWIAEQKGAEYCEFRCSACDGSVGQTDQFDETEVRQFSEWYKYCPNCGAKMEDKQDG